MKKALAVVLTAALGLSLMACGQKTETATEAAKQETKKETEVAKAEETKKETEAAADIKWPEKTITIVCGYKAGGDYDVNARAYAEELKSILGCDVVVSNIEGSGGAVAAESVKDSDPDGYTVFFHQPALLISRCQGIVDFGIDAYEMSCMALNMPGDLMCVNKSMGINTFGEFVDYVKAHPGEVNVAASAGTMNYIQCLQMQSLGLDINIVDGGNATDRVANLLGNQVDVILNSYGTVKDYLTTGDFVALATLAHERAEAYQDIPTAIEQGYEVYFDKLGYFVFPKGTDQAIVDKFAAAVKEVTEKDSYKQLVWDKWGLTPYFQPANEALDTLGNIDTMLQDYKEQLAQ